MSSNYFRVLGIPLAAGRAFTDEGQSCGPGRRGERHLCAIAPGRRDPLGATVVLDGEAFDVIGVLPEPRSGYLGADVFTPSTSIAEMSPCPHPPSFNRWHGSRPVSVRIKRVMRSRRRCATSSSNCLSS